MKESHVRAIILANVKHDESECPEGVLSDELDAIYGGDVVEILSFVPIDEDENE